MIPNRVEAEPVTHRRAVGGLRLRLIFIALGIAISVPSASLARPQNASAAGMQAERQQELAADAKAAKDVDVGSFYLHKGDYGAAISRLKEAVQLDPRYPKARLLLAESYAKQGDRTHALETYQAYLKEFPDARDEKKIQKKVEELSRRRD